MALLRARGGGGAASRLAAEDALRPCVEDALTRSVNAAVDSCSSHDPTPSLAKVLQLIAADLEEQAADKCVAPQKLVTPEFELTTPMLTMPFLILKEQGRISKSTKQWRTKALEKGWLVVHAKVEGGTGKVVDGVLDGTLVITSEGKVVIFLSHTCTRAASTPPTAACAHGSALTPSSSACPHRVGPRLCRQDQRQERPV